jgi:hypothetical protein
VLAVYFLDIDDFVPIIEVARQADGVIEERVGPYVRLSVPRELSIDRRATGTRHAVWYSSLGAVVGGRVVQFDKERLLIQALGEDTAEPPGR